MKEKDEETNVQQSQKLVSVNVWEGFSFQLNFHLSIFSTYTIFLGAPLYVKTID